MDIPNETKALDSFKAVVLYIKHCEMVTSDEQGTLLYHSRMGGVLFFLLELDECQS